MHKNSLITLTTKDTRLWKLALEQTRPYDFYHLPEFHKLAEMNSEGDAVMLVFAHNNHMIAFPMLLRDICIDGNAYKDAGCVHGFVGPLTTPNEIPEQMQRDFVESLNQFYLSRKIVSAFSRLHPLLDRSNIFSACGDVVDVGATLSIDLTVSSEVQLAKYRRNHRQDIDNLRQAGYTCRRVGAEFLGDFLRIYLDTMDRIHADSMYYFDYAYFERMMRDMHDVMHLFVCELNGSVASAALCGLCNGIVQIHLAGTNVEHKKLAPMKLVFDTVREWGNTKGARKIHLGGGVGAKRDSLYSFKKGFGADEHVYRRWQHIVDYPVYRKLCARAVEGSAFEPNTEYFPKYRDPRHKVNDLTMKTAWLEQSATDEMEGSPNANKR